MLLNPPQLSHTLDDQMKIVDIENLDDKKRLTLAKELTTNITECLPKEVDARAFTLESKIPFKATSLCEVLIHRIAELASIAVDLYEKDKLVSAFVITRAVIETVAMIYWLHEKVAEFLVSKDIQELDEFLTRAMLGSRDGTTNLESYNVLTAVDRADKEFPGFRKSYDHLCEFIHPNWCGALGSYGKIDRERFKLRLGSGVRRPPLTLGLSPLIGGLTIFEHYYNDLADLLYKMNDYLDSGS